MYAALPLRCQMMSTAQPFISLHNKTRQGRLVYFVELLVSGSWTFDSCGFSFRTSDVLCGAARLKKKRRLHFPFSEILHIRTVASRCALPTATATFRVCIYLYFTLQHSELNSTGARTLILRISYDILDACTDSDV
jgi:hypothetical protein